MVDEIKQPEIPKISIVERLCIALWAWRGKIFPHAGKQRWNPADKEIVIKTIGRLMLVAVALFFLGGALGFFLPIGVHTIAAETITKWKIQDELVTKILEVNKQIDPAIAETVAKVLMTEAPPIDPKFMLWVAIAESRITRFAKSPTGAEGLFQIMAKTQDGGPDEFRRYHIIPQVGRSKQELLKCYELKSTVQGMLFCYMFGPNKKINEVRPADMAEFNRYAAEIATGYTEEGGSWKK